MQWYKHVALSLRGPNVLTEYKDSMKLVLWRRAKIVRDQSPSTLQREKNGQILDLCLDDTVENAVIRRVMMALLPGDWEDLEWVEVFVDDDSIDDATVYSWLYNLLVPTLVQAGPRSFPSNHWVKAEQTPRWVLLNEGPHGLFTDTYTVMCLRLGHIVPWASIGHPDHVPPAEHAPRDSDGELLVFPQSASPPQSDAALALEDDGAQGRGRASSRGSGGAGGEDGGYGRGMAREEEGSA